MGHCPPWVALRASHLSSVSLLTHVPYSLLRVGYGVWGVGHWRARVTASGKLRRCGSRAPSLVDGVMGREGVGQLIVMSGQY